MTQNGQDSAAGCASRRSLAVLLLLLLVQLTGAPPVHAHGTLKRSRPSNGEHLSAVPRELRFTFTEHVEAATARVLLAGPDGSIELGTPALHPDSAAVLLVGIRGELMAGEYRVQWQVAGTDGHPMKGGFGFFIAPGAAGLARPAARGATQPSTHHPAATFPEGAGFNVESGGYVLIRWLSFSALLGVIGVVAFRIVLTLAARAGVAEYDVVFGAALGRTARLGLWLTALLLVAAALRLLAQSYALHGRADVFAPSLVSALIVHTLWGQGWLLQVGAGLLALLGFAAASRGGMAGWLAAGAGAVGLALSPGLSGHAAALEHLQPLPIIADGAHVLGAAGWLGALLGILLVAIPVSSRLPEGRRGPALAAVVNAYSPTALTFAAITVATGAFAGWLHLGGISQLWQSGYGRTLLLKLGVLAAVFATGAFNWLRVRPGLGADGAADRLRRSAAAELAIGALVLLITAVLVATSPPRLR